MYIILIILFLIGIIFGSFFTKIGNRLPKNESIITKSKCDSCGHELSFIEKIPVISYIIQKGRCKNCNSKISGIYIVFELLTGCLFPLVYMLFIDEKFPLLNIIIGLVFTSSLIIIMFSDIKYMLIPNEIIMFFSSVMVVLLIFLKYQNEEILSVLDLGYELIFMFIDALIMFVIMFIIKKIGDLIFKKESLGGGDIKLMTYIAIVIGYKMGIVVIFLASFLALPISIINAYKKNEQMLPFGPYLAIATLILYLLNINFDMILDFIH